MENMANEILKNIALLDQARSQLRERANTKSMAIANYDKALAKTIMGLRNGMEIEIDGEKISDPPVTIIDKVESCIFPELHLHVAAFSSFVLFVYLFFL